MLTAPVLSYSLLAPMLIVRPGELRTAKWEDIDLESAEWYFYSTKNKGMNSWIKYVKDFAAKKGIKYNEALKDPECKAGYKKLKGGEI